jgi:dTDP-glucose 4,6-dehydratase
MLLVTGGAGFIGLNFVKHLLSRGYDDFIVVDKLTYAANTANEIPHLIVADIADENAMQEVFSKRKITSVINFAAESHVDNSIKDWRPFLKTNVEGTLVLLQKSLEFGVERFIQISTDEVFGETDDCFDENSNIKPRNPYSASKAAAEHFVMAFHHTHGLPVMIVNSSNNYGPYQNKEKFIPTVIRNALAGKKVPIYGNGSQVRDWIYVKDTCAAITNVWLHGKIGERYCVGGSYADLSNLKMVHVILDMLHIDRHMVEHIADRPGHDKRYNVDADKIEEELGWQETYTLEIGLQETIQWIKDNENRI